MICSSQRKISSLTSRLFHTEQKVNVELKPRGRMFGRLGTAKMKHEWGVEVSDIVCCLNNMTKISASVGMIYCQKGSSLARGREEEREVPAAFRVLLC